MQLLRHTLDLELEQVLGQLSLRQDLDLRVDRW